MSSETKTGQTPRLNQIIAVRPTAKGDFDKVKTAIHRELNTGPLLHGQTRSYQPFNDAEDGEKQIHLVQVKAEVSLRKLQEEWAKLFNLSAKLDWTNQIAKADIVILSDPSVTLLKDVPVTHLMFMEKQVVDLETMIRKLPILDPTELWDFDPNTDTYKGRNPQKSFKTQKLRKTIVHYAATDKHPAQVEPYSEDVNVGTWTAIRQSGALPAERVSKMLARVLLLKDAIKFAREQANMTEVIGLKTGDAVMKYIFAVDA